METVALLALIVLTILSCGYFITKIIDWRNKYRYERYTNNSAEFIADCYKLKMKWVRRGEFMYCKALDKVIGAETEQYETEDGRMPESEYGKDYIRGMKNVIDEEVRKRADILS